MKNNRPHDNDDGESFKRQKVIGRYKNILSIYRILCLANDRVHYERVINIQYVLVSRQCNYKKKHIKTNNYFHIPFFYKKESENVKLSLIRR